MRRDSEDRSAYEETTALIQELDALKQRGSNLLVVGSRRPAAHRVACRQFLGSADAEPRRRVLALADPRIPVEERLSGIESDPDRLRIVQYPVTNRSTTSRRSEPGSASTSIPETTVERGDLGALGLAISEAIAEFEATGGEFSPSELRLCFDSIALLLSEHDRETAFRFLQLLTHRVRSVRGMAHYHLAATRENRAIALLEPLFDGIVELRLREGTLLQRWSLRDSGLATRWIEL